MKETAHPNDREESQNQKPTNSKVAEGNTQESANLPVRQLSNTGAEVRLFALLIGINIYLDDKIINLRGAVADSHAIKDFLRGVVGVPEDHIRHLVDREATSDALKLAIKAFETDERIRHGDPILIYYAGHGSEANVPDSWPAQAGNKVQMILPHDFAFEAQDSIHGQGLIDRTFSALLHNLAKAKGNNITVILDSCHSGSGTRGTKLNTTTSSRGVDLPAEYQIYPRIDEDIVSAIDGPSRGAVIAPNFARTGLASHVLLAACREDEKARESNGHGIFTNALLDTLRHVGFDKITYKDLILRLPDLALEQHPQCEGLNDSRFIFNSRVSGLRKIPYPIDIGPNRYTIHAGEAHGISAGAEFTIYKSLETAPIGTLYVKSCTAFTSLLKSRDGNPPLMLTDPSLAVETRKGTSEPAVRIVVQPNFLESLQLTHDEWHQMDQRLTGIMFVEDREGADLALLLDDDSVGFEILDKACADHGLTHTARRPRHSNEDVFAVLIGASHFYYHLRRSNKTGVMGSKVQLECTKVIDKDLDGLPVTVPDGENLNRDGLITILVDDDDLEPPAYGFKITNHLAGLPIYVSMFYFDNTYLSIDSYYQPPSARLIVPSLPPGGGSITIGYGTSGTTAFIFAISPGQDFDVGFVKLFLSTEYVDCSGIERSSPFYENEDCTRYSRAATTRRPLWDSSIITIAQKRKGAEQ